jgi:hypothetical protein
VKESLVSSGTTRGELPSVQRSALIASRPARRATADGYTDLKPPDHSCSENDVEFSRKIIEMIRSDPSSFGPLFRNARREGIVLFSSSSCLSKNKSEEVAHISAAAVPTS